MKKNKKTTKAAQKPAERPKLTDTRVKPRGKEDGGKTEGAREAQGEAGVRCSALLGDAYLSLSKCSTQIHWAAEDLRKCLETYGEKSYDYRDKVNSCLRSIGAQILPICEFLAPLFPRRKIVGLRHPNQIAKCG